MDLQFEEFMQFCGGFLDDSSKKLITLAKKRYQECDEEYKQSQEFSEYIISTKAKIDSDESRFFVHLRDFLSILKENKASNDHESESQDETGRCKRVYESSESERDFESSAKRRKIDGNKGFSEHDPETSEHSDSDQNMERANLNSKRGISEYSSEDEKSDREVEETSNTFELDRDEDHMQTSEHMSGNEIDETDIMNGDRTDAIELEDEKIKRSNKRRELEKVTSLLDSGNVVVPDNEHFDRDSSERLVLDVGSGHYSSLEKTDEAKTYHYENEIKKINAMFSSSEDEVDEEEIETATNIKNILQEQDDEKLTHLPGGNESYSEDEELLEKFNECGEMLKTDINKCFGSHTKLEDRFSDTGNSSCIAAANEFPEVLNISSETEEKMESNDIALKDRLIKEGSLETCSEIESSKDEDSKIEKWDCSEVLVIENKEKPLCLTIKRVKEKESEENVSENAKLRKSPARQHKGQIKDRSEDRFSSEELTISEDAESESNHDDDVLMSEKTHDFVNKTEEDSDSESADEDENQIVREAADVSFKKDKELSSSDEDQFDAAKAKKFREKCKKRYVVSVGKKKNKHISSPRKGDSKPTPVIKIEKERSPRKKKTPSNSPKGKNKCSPSKSPIIIFTDSESDSDGDDIAGFKKKFDEKVRKRFQIQNNPSLKFEKISVKGKPMKIDNDIANYKDEKSHRYESEDDFKGSDKFDDIVFSGKENNPNAKDSKREYNSDNKKSSEITERKEKRRINLITEEYYSSKVERDNDEYKQNKEKKHGSHKEIKVKVKDKHKNKHDKGEDKSPKKRAKQEDDNEQPGPSSASDVDSAKKKGSSRQIRKLEALLESIRNQIEKVRKRELDLEDLNSEISDYMLEDKLQRKFMKVWDKLCDLHKAVKSTGRPTDKYFRYQGTRYPDINRKLEKFINKKKVFPDYHDVRSIVMKVSKEKKLHLKSREIDDLSREAFTDVGNQLQQRRKKDFISTFHSPEGDVNPFSLYDDPALYDPELKKKLDTNRKSAKSNMEKVVEKYAALQYQVGDKTEDEGDDEEEEEEENDINTGVEDIDQLSGVDNSDSDNNTAGDNEHIVSIGDKSSGKTWEDGPCLEIENLENGEKSAFFTDVGSNSQVKSKVKEEISDGDPKERHFSEQLGLCRTTTTESDGNKQIDMTVTILSDNDDDNEVKCSDDAENDGMKDTSPKPSPKPLSGISEETSTGIEERSNSPDSMSVKIEIGKAEDETKNISDVSNVTVITDDEEEEENQSDQSLGLKIVSAHHVSLSDISKLHGEEEPDVIEIPSESCNEPKDSKEDLNSSGEDGRKDVKFQLEMEEEVENKAEVVKEKPQEIKKSLNDVNDKISDQIIEVLNSEPEVMIIDDVDSEEMSFTSKDLNVKLQKRNDKMKMNFAPGNQQRFKSSSNNVNRCTDRNIKVTAPLTSNTNTMNPVSSKGWNVHPQKIRTDVTRNTSVSTQQYPSNLSNANRLMSASSKVIAPLKANSNMLHSVSNKGWDVYPQTEEIGNKSHGRSKCTQLLSPNSNNANRLMGYSSKANPSLKMSSNIVSPVSNKGWNVQPQILGQKNSGSDYSQKYTSFSKQVKTFPSGNAKGTIPLKSNPHSFHPVSNKGWNVQSQVHGEYVKKKDSTTQNSQRFRSSSDNLNKFIGSSSKVIVHSDAESKAIHPASNTGLNVRKQNFGNDRKLGRSDFKCFKTLTSSSKQMNKVSGGNTKITSPSVACSKAINDIVVIDCDETEQNTTATNRCDRDKINSVKKSESASEVICIDDAVEIETSSEITKNKPIINVAHKTSKTDEESEGKNSINRRDLKTTQSPSSSVFGPTTKESDIMISKTCQSSVLKAKSEVSEYKDENRTSHESNRDEEKNRVEVSQSVDEVKKVETVDDNDKDNCNETTSKDDRTRTNLEKNIAEVDEETKSPSDIFAGSYGTVESNDFGSIESCHDSEVFENPVLPDVESVSENIESEREETPSGKLFTAVRLETVAVNEEVECSLDTLEDEFPTSGQEPEIMNDKTVAANHEKELQNENKSSSNLKLAESVKDTEETVQSVDNDIMNTTLATDVLDTSEDEQEVSGGYEDDDKISSTSCDIENFPKVKLCPDIKSKLLQLKKAFVKKPQLEAKSQAKTQDTTRHLSGSSGSAQWIEADENASLIETYQEPDSTPYTLAENLISSSSSENIIVLSDSE